MLKIWIILMFVFKVCRTALSAFCVFANKTLVIYDQPADVWEKDFRFWVFVDGRSLTVRDNSRERQKMKMLELNPILLLNLHAVWRKPTGTSRSQMSCFVIITQLRNVINVGLNVGLNVGHNVKKLINKKWSSNFVTFSTAPKMKIFGIDDNSEAFSMLITAVIAIMLLLFTYALHRKVMGSKIQSEVSLASWQKVPSVC